jgi:acetyl esterase/lipase
MRRPAPQTPVMLVLALAAPAIGALSGCVAPEGGSPAVPSPSAAPSSSVEPPSEPKGPLRIAYGPDALHFGDLRVPSRRGPHPVVVVIHGGCWLNGYGLDLMEGMSKALTGEGFATWNIEYRRLGDPGGGYPNTLTDIGMAVDKLRDLAPQHDLDLKKVIVVGHSAGGHLGVWASARHRLPAESTLKGADPLPIFATVSLAGILNLPKALELRVCGALAAKLLAGTPAEVPDRYAEASPDKLLPLGIRQLLIHGTVDAVVPLQMSEQYLEAAKAAGDTQISLTAIADGDHFDVITPGSDKWPQVIEGIVALVQ